MEKITELKVVRVRQMCDQPGCDGEMIPENYAFDVFPPIYPHRCNKCGYIHEYNTEYPEIRYIEIDNQD